MISQSSQAHGSTLEPQQHASFYTKFIPWG